jgi:hypothetical protein
VTVKPGQTFVFVSGVGGQELRPYSSSQHNDDTWWASRSTSNSWVKNGVTQSGVASYGALFVRFNVAGDPHRADAYFRDLDGRIVDQFTILAP